MSRFEDIRLLRITYLRGPNLWTYRSALETWLDLGALEAHPSNQLPGLVERLSAWLPSLPDHHCGVGEQGGFGQRLTEGTWMGHVLEHVVIELLNQAGMPTGFGQTRSTSVPGVYRMVFRARDESVARCALQAGHGLLMAAINDLPFDVPAAVEAVRDSIDRAYLGPSTANIVAAATERGIPHIRLNDGNLVQLGHGAAQRRIWTAETDRTGAIAEGIARDKDLTKQLLAAVGVPVPEGQIAASPEAAWEAAQDIGTPVVVKPSDGNHGRGVTLELSDREHIEAAWSAANRHGSEVLVERYVPGIEHRLLVVAGRVVAAARGETAWVVGDGRRDLQQLVDDQINSDPRRGKTEDHPLALLELDDAGIKSDLARQGLGPDAVPASGRRVLIQRNGNVAIDCTDEVHPDVAHLVALAARTIGLDIAGVDVVCEDISKPLVAQGGAVVEVNAGPGLLMHLKPAAGTPRPVGRAIVEHLFPPGQTGRIPVIGIAGTTGATDVARRVAWLLRLSGRKPGLACRAGLFLAGRRVEARDATGFDFAQRLLINRDVDAAVIENGPAEILGHGLVYDKCQVGTVMDLGGAGTLADFDVHETDQLPKVLRTQIDVVLPGGVGVLNADDERLADLASLCDGEVILYATAPTDALAAHRQAGGRAVLWRDGKVLLLTGTAESPLVLQGGTAELTTATVLAVVATAWACGLSPDLIAAGLATFETVAAPDPAATRT